MVLNITKYFITFQNLSTYFLLFSHLCCFLLISTVSFVIVQISATQSASLQTVTDPQIR